MPGLPVLSRFVWRICSENPPLNIRSALGKWPPKLDFVLQGLLPGSVGTIVGWGWGRRHTLLLQLSTALSTNTHATKAIFPISKRPSRVVFIAAEESLYILHIRLHFIDNWMKNSKRKLRSFHRRRPKTAWLSWTRLCASCQRLVIRLRPASFAFLALPRVRHAQKKFLSQR